MPPEVGYADTSSDIVKPINRMNRPRIGQDQEIEIGPPLLKPAPKLVKQPARIEMIENEMAKLEKSDHDRFRSWLYPSFARCFSSSDISGALWSGVGSRTSGMCHLLGRAGSQLLWRLDPPGRGRKYIC